MFTVFQLRVGLLTAVLVLGVVTTARAAVIPAADVDHAFASTTWNFWGAELGHHEDAGITVALSDGVDKSLREGSIKVNASVGEAGGHIVMTAFAKASASNDYPPGTVSISGGAGALAQWHDVLRPENPDIFALLFGTAVTFIFRPAATGFNTFSGADPYPFDLAPGAQFTVRLSSALMPPETKTASMTGLGEQSAALVFAPFTVLVDFPTGIELDMTLRANAAALKPGVSSTVDFSHTAELGTIYVADANGNYVPGSEAVRLVGESGILYDVQPIPEPAGAGLLVFGLSLVGGRISRRHSKR